MPVIRLKPPALMMLRADELCFLDISASHENRDTLIDVVRRTAEQCFMPLTVGGGVRRETDVRNLRWRALIRFVQHGGRQRP